MIGAKGDLVVSGVSVVDGVIVGVRPFGVGVTVSVVAGVGVSDRRPEYRNHPPAAAPTNAANITTPRHPVSSVRNLDLAGLTGSGIGAALGSGIWTAISVILS